MAPVRAGDLAIEWANIWGLVREWVREEVQVLWVQGWFPADLNMAAGVAAEEAPEEVKAVDSGRRKEWSGWLKPTPNCTS